MDGASKSVQMRQQRADTCGTATILRKPFSGKLGWSKARFPGRPPPCVNNGLFPVAWLLPMKPNWVGCEPNR
jgi:hypothetical protein